MRFLYALLLFAGLLGCGSASQPGEAQAQPKSGRTETAIFAGGCFWCTESDFEKVKGVRSAVSGFTGGRTANPTYEQVSAGGTGHYESVRVTYDPAIVSYRQLARYFFRTVDPLDSGGQFCDRGDSYRTAIFATPAQRKTAEAAKAYAANALRKPIATLILPAGAFYPAEEYHQDYYKKNPIRYHYYRSRCGRDDRLKQVWGK